MSRSSAPWTPELDRMQPAPQACVNAQQASCQVADADFLHRLRDPLHPALRIRGCAALRSLQCREGQRDPARDGIAGRAARRAAGDPGVPSPGASCVRRSSPASSGCTAPLPRSTSHDPAGDLRRQAADQRAVRLYRRPADLLQPGRRLVWLFALVWLASIVGVCSTSLFIPFRGWDWRRTIGGIKVDVSRGWDIDGGFDKRAAGFFRSSISAAMLLPILALIIAPRDPQLADAPRAAWRSPAARWHSPRRRAHWSPSARSA